MQEQLVAAGSQLFSCAICTQTFPSWRQCLRHQVQHQPDIDNLRCTQCSATCAGVAELIAHTMVSHQPSGRLLCKVCGKLFPKARYLRQHAVMHDKPRYQCHMCGRCFHWRAARNNHVKICARKQQNKPGCSEPTVVSDTNH